MKRKRRATSHTEYICYLVKKLGLSAAAAVVFVGAIVALSCGPLWILATLYNQSCDAILLLLSSVFCCTAVMWVGAEMATAAEAMEPIEPLIRSPQMLAPESVLVRPSSEPAQSQSAILLRSAHSGGETSASEMLRPLNCQQLNAEETLTMEQERLSYRD